MTIDSRDSRDSASKKKFHYLSKKVNDLFVDRNANVVTLQCQKSSVIFAAPKGNKISP